MQKHVGRPPAPGPTDEQILAIVHSKGTIKETMESIGKNTVDYYRWLKRGSSTDLTDHLKYPQCRKFALALHAKGEVQMEVAKEKFKEAMKEAEVFGPVSQSEIPPPPLYTPSVPENPKVMVVLKSLVDLVSIKMADGKKTEFACEFCQQSGTHNFTTGEYSCDCPCHEARKLLVNA